MTPLAYQITKELTLPVKRRTLRDKAGLIKRMDDIHCFECSEALSLITDLALHIEKESRPGDKLAFLPAPKTWIEWKYQDGVRVGVFLQENAFGAEVIVACYNLDSTKEIFSQSVGEIALYETLMKDIHNTEIVKMPAVFKKCCNQSADYPTFFYMIYAALALINTPRIIGRRQHMPHRGLECKLLGMKKSVGKFPLHAWTEIKLEISPPKDMSGDASHEAHLTGKRALHFCRAHLRIRLGQLEIVRSHWRGDGELGIRQSRYRMVPPPPDNPQEPPQPLLP